MEMEGQDFHTKVADAYLKIAEEHPERFVVVEADRPPVEVFDDVGRRSTRRSVSARKTRTSAVARRAGRGRAGERTRRGG